MKLIKQSKLLTFQVFFSLIILNTQIIFAQNKKINLKDWEGSYVGIGVANSSSKTEIRALNTTLGVDHYALNRGTKDKDQNEIIFKIGHLEQLNNNILLGIELNKYSDIETSTLNTNTDSEFFNAPMPGTTDRNTLKLKDIISLELKLAIVLENQDNFLNNSMIYGKFGVATLRSNSRSYEDNLDSHVGQSTARHYGSVIGLGVEKKLSIFDDSVINKNASISLEYNMMSFNKKTSGRDTNFIDTGYSVKPEINNLMLTVNYRLSDNTLGLKNLIK
jgi:opacity protein-like surface antigen